MVKSIRDAEASGHDASVMQSLTPTMFYILLALGDVERHGYGIMQELGSRTEGRVKLGPGTLYGSIKRMLAEGLIVESAERPGLETGDERRRYYRLTNLGRRVAMQEARLLARLVEVAREKKLLGEEN